ncbi:uncharacterized protein LOC135848787 [Planococcus citri]|uniref:uncharacterized protein LOC135848787 n=1 Tax=Planococcus citri TaxID=170843 RepID=UPI0031F8A7AD
MFKKKMNSRVFKMSSNERKVLLCFFIIVATNTIHFALGLYEPLYLRKSVLTNKYTLIYDVIRDVTDQRLFVIDYLHHDVLLACPLNQISAPFKIQESAQKEEKFAVAPYCEIPIKSHVYKVKPDYTYGLNAIGFPVTAPDPNKEPSHHYADVPEYIAIVNLIDFTFDESLHRVKMVEYRLAAGKFLKPEISYNDEEYQKDEDMFGYDVDQLYSKTKLPFVKVQLAPEDDFFFDNWKSASRHNVITAPMRRELLHEWQALEIFIRKVTQFIDEVNVKTGVFGTLPQSQFNRKMHLHDGKHPIPKYFWKAIHIKVFSITSMYTQGILFVMHNVDSIATSKVEKICPKDEVSLSNLGWEFSPDKRFRSSIYGCILNVTNGNVFQEKFYTDYELLNLHTVPVNEIDSNGNPTNFRILDVINEIQKLKQATDEFAAKQVEALKYSTNNK